MSLWILKIDAAIYRIGNTKTRTRLPRAFEKDEMTWKDDGIALVTTMMNNLVNNKQGRGLEFIEVLLKESDEYSSGSDIRITYSGGGIHDIVTESVPCLRGETSR